MADPYYRYSAAADRASVPRPSFPDYMSSEAPPLGSHPLLGSTVMIGASPGFLHNNINPLQPSAYRFDGISGFGSSPDLGLGGVTAGASIRHYPSPLENLNQRRDVGPGISPDVLDMSNEIPNSSKKADGLPVSAREPNFLFVDKLPTDCTRREVGHLFRPFIGYKDVKVVHREARRSGDKARVLCFVEFVDSRCARIAMEALQGYRFDDKKPESPALKIQFAHFPFRPPSEPSDHDEKQSGS
ncbi:RNA-binding protein 1-like isoform X1 [Juglans microcarpa x Juglans regia]|uniref:RNA-binding protein 1-like isoform X1 n=2 Tax=Juglans microcarpa x Juglans regia TaxID=2249226 RepID=UPI001B7DD1BD|nr:RNA-binding protein 1-like isoform X1 [Juglans microcarpa x Juglans regia]